MPALQRSPRPHAGGPRRACWLPGVLGLCLVAVPSGSWSSAAFGAIRRGALRGLGAGSILGLCAGHSPAKVSAEQLETYVEKDPALPGFRVSRPVGWTFDEQTLKQNTWKNYGRTLKFDKSGLSIEVSLQPIDEGKQKLSEFGTPEDFARAFANSAAKTIAPPSAASPSPVPKVTPLSMDASQDLRRLLAQYRLEVEGRNPLLFQQLIGLGTDADNRNYLYSLTAMAPEAEFDTHKPLFADIFKSFSLAGSGT